MPGSRKTQKCTRNKIVEESEEKRRNKKSPMKGKRNGSKKMKGYPRFPNIRKIKKCLLWTPR